MSNILTSLWGKLAGFDTRERLIVPGGLRSGQHGNQFDYPSPSMVVFHDDFMGDTLNTFNWHNPTKGSDAGTVDFAISQDVNGKAKGSSGASATGTMAVNGILIDSGLLWKANQGEVSGQVRLKISSLATIQLYAGFTDQVSTLEFPISLSGSTLTTNATDAVGFLYSTAATASTIKLVSVANDVDGAVQEAVQSTSTLTTAPVADTYITLRVSLNAAGDAFFFIDGKPVGVKQAVAVTPTVPLTFCVAAFVTAAITTDVSLDYITVSSARV